MREWEGGGGADRGEEARGKRKGKKGRKREKQKRWKQHYHCVQSSGTDTMHEQSHLPYKTGLGVCKATHCAGRVSAMYTAHYQAHLYATCTTNPIMYMYTSLPVSLKPQKAKWLPF